MNLYSGVSLWLHAALRNVLFGLYRFKNWDISLKNLNFWLLVTLGRCGTEGPVLPGVRLALSKYLPFASLPPGLLLLAHLLVLLPTWPPQVLFRNPGLYKYTLSHVMHKSTFQIRYIKVECCPKRVWSCLFSSWENKFEDTVCLPGLMAGELSLPVSCFVLKLNVAWLPGTPN